MKRKAIKNLIFAVVLATIVSSSLVIGAYDWVTPAGERGEASKKVWGHTYNMWVDLLKGWGGFEIWMGQSLPELQQTAFWYWSDDSATFEYCVEVLRWGYGYWEIVTPWTSLPSPGGTAQQRVDTGLTRIIGDVNFKLKVTVKMTFRVALIWHTLYASSELLDWFNPYI